MTPEDLEQLCRDRPLITPEVHLPNDFYGHARLLKSYARWPLLRPLRAVVEMAPNAAGIAWVDDLESRLPVALCASEHRAGLFASQSSRPVKVVPIGPLIHYLPRHYSQQERQGTCLVFPPHSTHRVRVEFDRAQLLERLERLRPDFDRIVVCVYWKNVLDGGARYFHDRGFECVSAGHMYDPQFLPRLVEYLSSASLVYTTVWGTHVLYSTLLGTPVWIEQKQVSHVAPESVLATDVAFEGAEAAMARLCARFSERLDAVSSEQREFVEDYMGETYTRPPAALRSVFADAESRYRREASLLTRARHLKRRGVYLTQRLRATVNALRDGLAG